jgi:glucose/arabinose dehydrogenase
MAEAPDGRLFFNELDTGDVRVLAADGTLVAAPFAHVDVRTGGHNGLLGLALAPDFATSGHLYVSATVPGTGGEPDRLRVVRFTDAGGVGTDPTVVVDGLPAGTINDGGDLAFGRDGTLFVSVGDADVAANAQDDASLAGRALRYTAAGAVPADNPVPGSPEWCRGLRNTFAIAVHPATGALFGADNGPTSDDELNYLEAGKNFGWPSLPPGTPGSSVGFRVAHWADVIVPTAIAWAGDSVLYLTAYDDASLRRLALSGAAHTDLDAEETVARFREDALANKPLDVLVAADGSILVSTFTAIWRLRSP